MPVFNYQAKDQKGHIREGVVEAPSVIQASEILHGHGLVVLALHPKRLGLDLSRYFPFLGRVSRKEIVLFSRQLATLINARVPIVQALEVLLQQVASQKLKEVIGEMIADIEGGKSLSETTSRFPQVFSNLYVNLIRSAELSGTLAEALSYLADQEEKDYALVSKIRGAMIYPLFIISAIIIVGALMFIFVLPQMIAVLKEAGAELPLTTKILIFATEVMQKYWLIIILTFVALAVGLQIYIRSSGGRLIWDRFKLKLPILSKLLERIYIDRFSRNLSTLIAGGIPIVYALQTVSAIVGNTVYRDILLDAAQEVETGKSIADVFQGYREVPGIVTQMVRIGEQTGTLDEILEKLAKFYDREVESNLATLTTLLEPIVMILLGLAVAVMVAGILLPIYNLASVQ
ncbi:MAG: type II secretion system F family protein [Candidatus Doudnabacteria bacterium]|nr:type II secretion system F family protein [Candidatus Doudnabacteria bacterium]